MRPVRTTFVVFGAFWGSWAVAAFDVQRFLRFSDGELGLLLSATVLGGVLANGGGGVLAERHGTRRTLAVALVLWGAGLLLAGTCHSRPGFIGLFLVVVATGGLVDIVMNVAATSALGDSPSKIMRAHALFNAGNVVGAAATGIVLALDGSWRLVWSTLGVVSFVLAVWVFRAELPAGERGERVTFVDGLRALHREKLLVIALVFTLGALVEGGVGTWGVLYLRSRLELAAIAGAAAYVAGQVLAAIARASLGGIADRVGGRRGARLGLVLAAAGLVLESATDIALIAGLGLVAASVGAAVYWPLLLAHASKGAERPGLVVGGIGAAGYVGFLTGPPVVGWVAEGQSLRTGLLALAGVAALASALSLLTHTREPSASTSGGTDSSAVRHA